MTTSERRAGFPWLLSVFALAAFCVLVTLGVWQVQRLTWKEELIAQAEAASTMPPAPLAEVLAEVSAEGDDAGFRRVIVDCPGLATAPFVELRTIQERRAGVRLVSLCRPAGNDGPAYLVDRGFVAEETSARPSEGDSDAPLSVTAVIRAVPPPGPMALAPEGRLFYARDPAAMAAVLDAALGAGDVDSRTLYALTSSNPEWAALEPSAPPAAFSNDHLGYALTWFGLAAALAAIWGVFVFRRLRREGGA